MQFDDYVQLCEDAQQQMDETRCIMEYKYIYKLDEEVHGQPQSHTLLGMAHLLSLVITMP